MKNYIKNNLNFIPLKTLFERSLIPEIFPDPYNHTPHPLCVMAANELQHYIQHQRQWNYDFDIDNLKPDRNSGKMFGVLIVKNSDNEIGYLAAFSGLLGGKDRWPSFVPPVSDIFDKKSFFRKGEKEIDLLTKEIIKIESSPEYIAIRTELIKTKDQYANELNRFKIELKETKALRTVKREKAISQLNKEEFSILKDKLENQSRKEKYDLKKNKESWLNRIDNLYDEISFFNKKIIDLKDKRKRKSSLLQKQIFDSYQFLNNTGEIKTATDIFKDTAQRIPPAGAGDCAAPKLLQYAFINNMKPLAIAEFWWGQSPQSIVRKHRYFYPPCKGKCEPILKHMLKGITLKKESLFKVSSSDLHIETIYEDRDIIIINKPSGLLSVSGKVSDDSVFQRIKNKYPQATGPLVVHRLDMFTSGLMVIAKTESAYKTIQKQFTESTVKKEYIALLKGTIKSTEGMIDLPLIEDYNERPRQCVSYETGKPAKTLWKLIDSHYGKQKNYSKVLFIPQTGRTHQIRVHAAHYKGLNTPIVGDNLYGIPDDRLYLHALSIEFIHPVSKKVISFKIKEDF